MIAYVMLQLVAGKCGQVVSWLRKLEGVGEAYAIYGEHDAIAKVEVPDSRSLDTLVMETIQATPDVIATTTLIAMEAYPRVRRRRAVGRARRRARRTAARAEAEGPRRMRRARRVKKVAPPPTTPPEAPPSAQGP